MCLCVCRQDTRSSSDALTQLTPMLVSSRSLRCSCCCWTACGSFGGSSPWLWASLRHCSCDWRLKFMPRIMAPFCVTVIRKGQFFSTYLKIAAECLHFKLRFTLCLPFNQVCLGSKGKDSLFVPGSAKAHGEGLLL